MTERTTSLDSEARSLLRGIGTADLLIGIPSYRSLHSIVRVVTACFLGLAKYFPDRRGVIFVSEGGEAEEIRGILKKAPGPETLEKNLISPPDSFPEIVVTNYVGTPGKGSAIRAILEAAKTVNAEGCCVVDSDLRSISPEWIELLVAPIVKKGFGFVTPYYSRHKYDGTITNLIAYPLTRALYGRRVRQPIGGDFGFSRDLANSLLDQEIWETDIARFGIDIWMTTVAIHENFKICQSFLGAKIHEDKDPGKDLAPMFTQVVGTLFSLMVHYDHEWIPLRSSRPTAIFGFETEVNPRPVHVDKENLIHSFREGVPTCRNIWQEILEPENYYKIMEVAEGDDRYFELPFEIWVKTVYDFALAFCQEPDRRGSILSALVPIYFAATATYVEKTLQMDSHQAEAQISRICTMYENLKPYLVERWQSRSSEGDRYEEDPGRR